MIYRLKSTDVFYNFPGVQAVYMPLGAPDPISARQNVRNNLRNTGVYTATPGVVPTWTPRAGWGFNGSSQYLTTNITPNNNQTWTMIIRFTNATGGTSTYFAGCTNSGTTPALILSGRSNLRVYGNSGTVVVNTALTSGVLAVSGKQGYVNGVADGGTIGVVVGTFGPIGIGAASNNMGLYANFASYNNLATAIYSRPLAPAEVWQASLQMKYCDQNEAWNVWARRRQYFIVPVEIAAGGAVGIYGRRGVLALPGGVSIKGEIGNQ